ncbi:MAG: type III-B CRISPR module RAMP protein Cmr6 [Ignavibacteriales bacterium]|nr:type III-B CRISPR module RAMP protein Cmr6 [Ignavibacteriales bacterium]
MRNLGLLFYKEYFEALSFKQNGDKIIIELNKQKTKENNSALFNSQLLPNSAPEINFANASFELTTIYPGLLIGSGYNHEVGGQDNELKLGFFFDYTTGLPCIPGSSVKGVLRDACTKAKGEYAISILNELRNKKSTAEEEENADWLNQNPRIDEIFKCLSDDKDSEFVLTVFEGKKDSNNILPLKERDIFFDAFPIVSLNKNKIFLGNDYITPHKHESKRELDPFTNPNPIQFMKILPQVTVKFSFRLSDSCLPGKIKKELFKQILLDLGVGAKTNVGYGQFH